MEKSFENPPTRKGLAIMRALAVSNSGSGGNGAACVPRSSFFRALASASGSPVMVAPVWSA